MRIERHRALGAGEPIVEAGQIGSRHVGDFGNVGKRRRRLPRHLGRSGKSGRAISRPRRIADAVRNQLHQQTCVHRHVGSGTDGKMNIGDVAGRRMPRVDRHDLGAAHVARGDKALIEHRMAPCRIAADQDDEIRRLDIIVAARHDVLAESPDVTGDRRRHAQPRISVDIGAADETFHQLVGDVIVLSQELAGDIERYRIRPMLGDGLRESGRDTIERLIPARVAAAELRVKQSSIGGERVAQRRALRAEPAGIGGMVRVSRDAAIRRDAKPAADAAIGTRRADHAACHCSSATGVPASAVAAMVAPRACSAKARPKTI